MKPLSQINVIPFIDVMLVLLAIVLMTATFVAQGKIPVDIPETAQADALPTEATLELTIDEAGALYLDGAESALEILALRLGWTKCLEEIGVTINVTKAEILTVKKQDGDVDEVVVGGEEVNETELVKYLRYIFTKEGDKTKERSQKM